MRHCSRLLLILLLVLTYSSNAASASSDRFQIDMIIYANTDTSAQHAENWPDNILLRYPKNWARLKQPNNGASLELVESTDAEFARVAASIRRSSRYKKLFQASWQQDLTKKSRSKNIIIQGGKRNGNHYELEGYINIALERYLHLSTDLWLVKYGENEGNYYLPRQPYRAKTAVENAETNSNFLDNEFEASEEYRAFLRQNPELDITPKNDEPVARVVVMKQQRRMRSDELHYLDHPLFGVIVKITKPIAITQAAPL